MGVLPARNWRVSCVSACATTLVTQCGGPQAMAKALLGHVGGPDPRMVSEMRRLQRRVRDLEAELARLQEVNDVLAAGAGHAILLEEREPGLTGAGSSHLINPQRPANAAEPGWRMPAMDVRPSRRRPRAAHRRAIRAQSRLPRAGRVNGVSIWTFSVREPGSYGRDVMGST